MSSDVADLVVHVTTGPEAVADIQRAVFAGGPPSGPASGDLADSYPAPSVVGIRGRDIADVAPADLSFLGWDAANTRWSPMELPISYGDSDELTGGLNTGLHYHDSDRARANHTGEQAISTVTGLQSALDGKQDSLTFDTVPTDASTNPVESNGVYDAVQAVQDDVDNAVGQHDFTIRNVTTATDTATVEDSYISLDTGSNNVALTLPETNSLMLHIRHDRNSAGDNEATITNQVSSESGPWVLDKGNWICLIFDGTEWMRSF